MIRKGKQIPYMVPRIYKNLGHCKWLSITRENIHINLSLPKLLLIAVDFNFFFLEHVIHCEIEIIKFFFYFSSI